MSLWLRAFCTKSLRDVTFEQLTTARQWAVLVHYEGAWWDPATWRQL